MVPPQTKGEKEDLRAAENNLIFAFFLFFSQQRQDDVSAGLDRDLQDFDCHFFLCCDVMASQAATAARSASCEVSLIDGASPSVCSSYCIQGSDGTIVDICSPPVAPTASHFNALVEFIRTHLAILPSQTALASSKRHRHILESDAESTEEVPCANAGKTDVEEPIKTIYISDDTEDVNQDNNQPTKKQRLSKQRVSPAV